MGRTTLAGHSGRITAPAECPRSADLLPSTRRVTSRRAATDHCQCGVHFPLAHSGELRPLTRPVDGAILRWTHPVDVSQRNRPIAHSSIHNRPSRDPDGICAERSVGYASIMQVGERGSSATASPEDIRICACPVARGAIGRIRPLSIVAGNPTALHLGL